MGKENLKTMKYILDTNVIVRFLIGDNSEMQKRAERYFQDARDNKDRILIFSAVIAEVVFVLESVYSLQRKDIITSLESFLSFNIFEIEDKEIIFALFEWYAQGLHFIDSYLLAYARKNKYKILTFDKQINKKQAELS